MQRMTRIFFNQTSTRAIHRLTSALSPLFLAAIVIAPLLAVGATSAQAQMGGVMQADYAGSGFVTPAGMMPPDAYYSRQYPNGIMQVGLLGGSACDAAPCDSGCATGCCASGGCTPGGCDSACGGGACRADCLSNAGGILGAGCGGCDNCSTGIFGGTGCKSCLGKGCLSCGGLGRLNFGCKRNCFFCGGTGCSACNLFSTGSCANAMAPFIDFLRPHQNAGICAQRWYDVSLEAVFLDHSVGGGSGAVTSLGVDGPRVLSLGTAGVDMEAGVRVSTALIFGPGSNLEFTYMGGNKWNGQAQVNDQNDQLFSVISNFGQNPLNGFDDTDRSFRQAIDIRSELHSGELNYRRRTVWPCCRFQGSWLVGLKYVRYDDALIYSANGSPTNGLTNQPRFFRSNDKAKNNLFGPQIGYDFWWNMRPGISIGYGLKGAWVQNDLDRTTTLSANSLDPLATPGTITITDSDQDTTIMGEFEAKMVYRMSHSWTFRTAYYAMAIDDIAFGNLDVGSSRDFLQLNTIVPPPVQYDSLVLQGVSFGGEFMW